MEDDEEDIYAPEDGGQDNATGLPTAPVNAALEAGEDEDDEGEEEDSDSVCKKPAKVRDIEANLCTPGYRYHH